MSRTRKALTLAAFSYSQSIVNIGVNIFLVRFLLHRLGASSYGLWTAATALLAYGAMVDLGMLGVLPWLFAEADGRKDVQGIRRVLSHGLALGLIVGALYLLAAGILWSVYPVTLKMSATDRSMLAGPLALLVCSTALSYPLKVFNALLSGLQDVVFVGVLGALPVILNTASVVILTRMDRAYYGLALGVALPPVVYSVASLIRIKAKMPDLLKQWPKIERRHMVPIFSGGVGGWLGSMGWQLAFASDTIIIVWLGYRALVPLFGVMTNFAFTFMMFSWTLPDSALVGLAQLGGEGNRERTREVVLTILRTQLILSGAVACAVLAMNRTFVTIWIGPEMFGGMLLNALVASIVVVLSITHGLVTTAAVLGNRPLVGAVTLVNGVIHVIVAVALGKQWGLVGIAAATILVTLLTSLPLGVWLLQATTGMRLGGVMRDVVKPWLIRFIPLAGAAFAVGTLTVGTGVSRTWILGSIVGVCYIWGMKPLYRDVNVGPRLTRWLAVVGLK